MSIKATKKIVEWGFEILDNNVPKVCIPNNRLLVLVYPSLYISQTLSQNKY